MQQRLNLIMHEPMSSTMTPEELTAGAFCRASGLGASVRVALVRIVADAAHGSRSGQDRRSRWQVLLMTSRHSKLTFLRMTGRTSVFCTSGSTPAWRSSASKLGLAAYEALPAAALEPLLDLDARA